MHRTKLSAALVFATMLFACAGPAPQPNPGFVIIDQDRVGEIQVAEDVDWASYATVLLAPATVEFREDWVQDQRRLRDNSIRDKDQERIKSEISNALDEMLFKELTNKGYTVTNERVAGAMLFRPRIVELDIYLPSRVKNYIGFSMIDSKGRMKIELEIFDPTSGKLLLTSWRDLDDPQDGVLELADSAGNQRAFYLMMRRWADWLFDGLDDVRQLSQ